jgi:hypothetical protein
VVECTQYLHRIRVRATNMNNGSMHRESDAPKDRRSVGSKAAAANPARDLGPAAEQDGMAADG